MKQCELKLMRTISIEILKIGNVDEMSKFNGFELKFTEYFIFVITNVDGNLF